MTWPAYDTHQLVDEVAQLLRDRGLELDPADDRSSYRTRGAADLLSGLGVTPTFPPEQTLDLNGQRSYTARLHGD